jgi:MazG family protein
MKSEAESAEMREFSRLLSVIRNLRRECPWDREQTIAGSARHVIEEAYEVAEAIRLDDNAEIREELGDLLSQVLFISVVAESDSRFSFQEVAREAANKLIRRHPHVYGDVKAETTEEVLANWEKIKRAEKGDIGIASVGRGLPALMRAQKLGEHARRHGMDWANAREVLAKVREELDEAEAELERGRTEAAAAGIGDMLLALANAPRFLGHSAEEDLLEACDKFVARFQAVERIATARGLDLTRLSPAAIDALWQEAKRQERP